MTFAIPSSSLSDMYYSGVDDGRHAGGRLEISRALFGLKHLDSVDISNILHGVCSLLSKERN